MSSKPATHRQMETQASNISSHPGNIVKPPKSRTEIEVEAERAAKAQAKDYHELARKRSIERAARFECADLIREDK